jgi:hypothetical protein
LMYFVQLVLLDRAKDALYCVSVRRFSHIGPDCVTRRS